MSLTTQARIVGVAVTLLLLGSADAARTAAPPAFLCKPPKGGDRLPPTARHGLIDHMRQYPVLRLATRTERNRARRIVRELVGAAERGNWRSVAAAERTGYHVRTRPRAPGDSAVYFFHAERSQEPRRGTILNAERPKALIYANVPGGRLILVGAMWSTRDGEVGPTPAGPILRWHSHVVCKNGTKRGLKPPPSGVCPPGSRLQQGASEMLHVWFTPDLRSAFAIRAPRPELCAAGLLPREFCAR